MRDLETSLDLRDAIELAHAVVQSIADERNTRVLFLKGASLASYGLREERMSVDVDVLVDPQSFDDIVTVLERLGWHMRRESFVEKHGNAHSKAFVHPSWPCDIDVHFRFPGFLADSQVVFDELWRRRCVATYAHRPCQIPDRAGSILILALHCLRGDAHQQRHAYELRQLTSIELSAAERADLVEVARSTGSIATLTPVLAALGIEALASEGELSSSDYKEWMELTAAGGRGPYFWVYALRHAQWRSRPQILWRGFWPTRADMLIDPTVPDKATSVLAARMRRLRAGLIELPSALRAMGAHPLVRPLSTTRRQAQTRSRR